MITLKKVKWGYYFSYGDNNEIDLTENVVTQIIGENGNGKSSIPLILEEIIFNKNSKGIKKADIPNRYADKGYWGILTFDIDGEDEYRIEVDRKSTLKVKLYKNEADISSHTASNTFKTIEELFANDFKTTSQLIYQNNNTGLQFLTATDTTRKKFLIDLLQLDRYVELFELFKRVTKEHATDVTKLQGQIDTIERWLEQNRLEDLAERPLLELEGQDILQEDERKYAELSVELNNIEKTNKQIAKNNQYRNLLAAINIGEINAIEVQPIQSYDEEQSVLGGLTSEKRRKEAYIKKMEGLGDTCPTCEQEIEADFKENLINVELQELKSIETQIVDLNAKILEIKTNNQNHQFKQEKVKEWEELFNTVNKTLPTSPVDKQSLSDELSNITIRISNARQRIKEINEANQKAASVNSRIAVFKEQSTKFLAELDDASKKHKKATVDLSRLEVLKKAFSTNGLVAYKIENLVKDLEDLTNEYLAELSAGRFTLEFSVQSDKLNVNITDNGNDVDILALSSGELARVNTSTLLALRKLMSSISKTKINVLFLDEVINVLDEQGREKLVEVLLEQDLNTYIVSHGWTHPLLAKLVVVKEDEMSHIEQE